MRRIRLFQHLPMTVGAYIAKFSYYRPSHVARIHKNKNVKRQKNIICQKIMAYNAGRSQKRPLALTNGKPAGLAASNGANQRFQTVEIRRDYQ